MAPEVRRVRYFTGEFLKEDDFNAEQAYHMRMRYLHNRWLHTWGIVNGLEVTKGDGLEVVVEKGMALVRVTEPSIIEFKGEDVAKELVLTDERRVSLPAVVTGGSQYYIVASYDEKAEQPAGTGETRWLERPAISAVPTSSLPPPDNETTLILARVLVNNGADGIESIDSSERRTAGVRGDVEATRVRLPVTGVLDSQDWPTLRGGAARRLDLAGSLNITNGNLALAGSLNITNGNVTLPEGAEVDGRDVSADGALLDEHLADAFEDMALHVTDGNQHNHIGGNGAPIPWGALTGVPNSFIKAFASINCTLEEPALYRSFNVTGVTRPGGATGAFTLSYGTIFNPMFFLWLEASELRFAYITTSGATTATFSVVDGETKQAADPTRLNVLIF